MALLETNLLETVDRVATAVERIQTFEPPEGYYLAFSGGKDSQVILDLAERSGVRFDAHMNLTTVDPPELLRFVRENYADRVVLERPQTSMYKLIIRKHFPPTGRVRYCCASLKERGGHGRVIITGVRWAESSRRSKRRFVESCFRDSSKVYVNPIIDWSDDDVWEYLNGRDLPHCSLYDEGRARIGCVMCPMARAGMREEAERWPKFAAMYRRACRKSFDEYFATRENVKWKDGDEMYEWWISGVKKTCDDPQLFPMDN